MPAQLVKLHTAPDLADQAYHALLQAVCDGSLAPGSRVTQEDLAERLAVSRQPVLQALRQLKADGLLVDAPGRGLQVAPLDAGWISQVYQVRGALDTLAAGLAAERRAVIDTSWLSQGRRAAAVADIPALIEADVGFHNAVYAASGNELIARSAQLHWAHLRRVMGAVLRTSTARQTIWDEHAAIAQAIAAGDAARARHLVAQHGRQAASTLVGRVARLAEAQPAESPTEPTAARRPR